MAKSATESGTQDRKKQEMERHIDLTGSDKCLHWIKKNQLLRYAGPKIKIAQFKINLFKFSRNDDVFQTSS